MNSSARPDLLSVKSAAEFRNWYWLKEELLMFCRARGLPSSGMKPQVADRIAAFLDGKPFEVTPQAVRGAQMPSEFTLETVIAKGWRCSPALGAFLRGVCGKTFHFNKPMRDFIHQGAGHTLLEAAEVYRASQGKDAPKREIPPQLEYNRHTREFYEAHPGATREQVLAAWWAKRGKSLNDV